MKCFFSHTTQWLFAITCILVAVFCLYILVSGKFPGAELRFVEEEIIITISPERLRVEGTYLYQTDSSWPGRYPILYPFFLGPDMPFPDAFFVALMNQEGEMPLSFHRKGDLMRFSIPVTKNRPAKVRVIYEQSLSGNRAVYLTETTLYWRRPVEKADFVIRLKGGLDKVAVHTPYNEMFLITDEKAFSFREFYPEGNFVIEWEGKK